MSFLSVNPKLKLLSLLCAAVLWLFVFMEGEGSIELPLAVRFVNIPAGSEVRSVRMQQPVAMISGPRILLLRQKLTGASLELDLAGAVTDRVDFNGLERYLSLSAGLRPLRISPGSYSVLLVAATSTDTK